MASAGGIRAGKAYVELGLTDKIEKGLKAAEAKLKAFGSAATAIGKTMLVGAAGVAAPLLAAGKAYAEVGAALEHASAKTGASVEALSTLGYAAQQSGVDMEGLEKGMTKMQKTLAQARSGSKQAEEAFSALGINIADLKGMSPDQQFKAIADKLATVSDPANRAAAAMAVFGKSGADLLPLLDQGKSGIDAMQARARALGLEMSGDSAKGAKKLSQAFDDLQDVMKMAVVAVGSAVAPVLQDFAQRAVRIVGEVMKWVGAHKELIATALKVAAGVGAVGAVLVAAGTAAALLAPAIGAIAAVIGTIGAPVAALALGVIGIGAAFAYAVGSGDSFASRLMSGLGKVADFLDTMLGSWDGFTTSLAEIWQQLKPRLENVWLDLKGSIIGIWDELKTSFPEVVYGWGGALAEFAVKAWTVIRDLAVKVANAWRHAQYAVMDAVAEQAVRQKYDPQTADTLIKAMRDARAKGNAAEDAQAAAQIDANNAGGNKAVADIEAWRQHGKAMTPEEHAAENQKHQADIEAEKQKNKDAAAKDWADYLANKMGLPRLSDAIRKALGDAKDFFGKGPELPAVPDVKGAAEGGLDGLTKKLGAVGTFNARAVSMIGAGGVGERTAKATEETARHARRTADGVARLEPLAFS